MRSYSLSQQNSLKFSKDLTRDRIFFYINIVCTFVRFCISVQYLLNKKAGRTSKNGQGKILVFNEIEMSEYLSTKGTHNFE